MKHIDDPTVPEPTDMTADEEVVKWKVHIWSQEVDRYGGRRAALDENKGALYAVLVDKVSNIIKLKLKSKTGYLKADEVNNFVWLLETLKYIMINSEDVKPKTLAIDDQMKHIMKLKQG